jgi:hypothetical protein
MPFEHVFGNGGLLTTVGDLLRWNRNFTGKHVGGQAFVDAQLQRGRLNDGRTIAYAAGLMLLNWKGLPEVSHSGSTAGYSAWLGRYPEQGLSVAVLCNLAVNATQYGHQVADVFLANAYPQPKPELAPPVDAAGLAGLYRSVRDHQTITVEFQDRQLRLSGRGALRSISPGVFGMGDTGRAEFEVESAGGVRLRLVTETDPGSLYEKVERAAPTRAELEAMAGEYRSDEADVTYTVRLEQDRLVMHRRPNATIPLTPAYRDGFSSTMGSIRFLRDASGRVTELSVGEGRVWDLRFRRITGAVR